MVKVCTSCGESRPESDFYRDRQKRDDLRSSCKSCTASRKPERYASKQRQSPVALWLRGETNAVPDGIELWLWSQLAIGADGGCLVWIGPKDDRGYGRTTFDGTHVAAHQVAIRLWRGDVVTSGLNADHLCRNPSCCNPEHIEVVTSRENTMRGENQAALNTLKTRCPEGHEYTPENTRIYRNKRYCRECSRQYDRRRGSRRGTGRGDDKMVRWGDDESALRS